MIRRMMNDKGFSLTELMFAMTILAIGLLAMAQMQIMAVRGTKASRDFSIATNLAREGIEEVKPSMLLTVSQKGSVLQTQDMFDHNIDNDDEDLHAPDIQKDTDITSLEFDKLEVLQKVGSRYEVQCWKWGPDPNCNAKINDPTQWDYVRIRNIKNLPEGSPDENVMAKDINEIVLWKEGASTRSVSVRTLIVRKDESFY